MLTNIDCKHHLNISTKWIGHLGIIAIIFTSFVFSPNIINGVANAKSAWFFIWIGFILLSSAFLFKTNNNFSFNKIDLLVCLFLIHTVLNSSVHDLMVLSRKNMEISGLLLFYLFSRKIYNDKEFIFKSFEFVFLLLSLAVVATAVLQWYELIPSFNHYFKITGFFFNPAPFAIYLAALSVLCLTLFLFSSRKIIIVTALVLFLLSLPILLITASRAAWLGAIAAIVLVIEIRFSFFSNLIKHLKTSTIFIIALMGVAIVVFASYQLFLFKKDSANGRLLTWKLTGAVIKDHYIMGVGPGNFPASLLNSQSNYFHEHPDNISKEGQLAGETWYAFNDLLQIMAEQGIAGFCLISMLIYTVTNTSFKLIQKINLGTIGNKPKTLIIASMAMLMVILFSGLFSYPLTLLPFQILFFQLIALLSSIYAKTGDAYVTLRIPAGRKLKAMAILVYILLGLYFVSYGITYHQGYKKWHISETNNFQDIDLDELTADYPFLLEDPWFAVIRGNDLVVNRKFEEAVMVLESAKRFCSNKGLYYTLGLAYKSLRKNDKAEEQYKFLEYALPSLVRPKYLLAKLYYETGQTDKWKKKGLEVINLKPKIQSKYIEAMIHEIKGLYGTQMNMDLQ